MNGMVSLWELELTRHYYKVPAKYREDDRSCIGPSLVTPMLMHYCQGEEVPLHGRNTVIIKYCETAGEWQKCHNKRFVAISEHFKVILDQ